MARKLGKRGLTLIKSFESYVGYVYDDLLPPVHGRYREWQGEKLRGTATIGYGHTDAAKHPLKIERGLKISERKAAEVLDVDLDECEDAVNALVKVSLTQGQFDALVSFAFNCGVGNLKKLIVPLSRGDYDGCRRKFGEYIRSKGQVLRGLQRRRAAEQALWDDRYEDVILPNEPVVHTAEVDAPEPPPKTGITEGAVAGGGLGAAAVASQVWDAVKEAPEGVVNAVVANPKIFLLAAVVIVFAFIAWQRLRQKAA